MTDLTITGVLDQHGLFLCPLNQEGLEFLESKRSLRRHKKLPLYSTDLLSALLEELPFGSLDIQIAQGARRNRALIHCYELLEDSDFEKSVKARLQVESWVYLFYNTPEQVEMLRDTKWLD